MMGDSPRRVRQSRVKGWRKPENAVSVARPSRWGNPFRIGVRPPEGLRPVPTALNAADAVALYRNYLVSQPELLAAVREELAGKNLMCFCPLNEPCHADVLLEAANVDAEGKNALLVHFSIHADPSSPANQPE